ncbi:MAG: helix-turn-helix transcriptional regulator [Bacteroidota bacterium]
MDKDDSNRRLGRCVRSLRERRGMEQPDVAALLDCTKQYVSRVELGKVSVTYYWIERFCEAMEISVEEFIQERQKF